MRKIIKIKIVNENQRKSMKIKENEWKIKKTNEKL